MTGSCRPRTACLAGVALAIVAGPCLAGPGLSRDTLGEAIRAVLIDTPALLAPLRASPPPDPYAEDVARDRALLTREAAHLFAPGLPGFGAPEARTRLAFFTRSGCPDCAQAEAELRALARRLPIRVALIDIEREAALAARLGLDMAPSYVLRDRLLRGAMPAIVLERYLAP